MQMYVHETLNNFHTNTPQRKWPMLRQHSQKCGLLAAVVRHTTIIFTIGQARNQRGGNPAIAPPKFSQTYVFVRCCNKLHHLTPPENISWLQPCNRLSSDFHSRFSFSQKFSTVFNETNHKLWLYFTYRRLISVTQQQELQTSGISSKAINHLFSKSLLVFADFLRGTLVIYRPDKNSMLTQLLHNLLKLEYHACFQKIEQWITKICHRKCSLALSTHSEVRNKS